VIEKQTLDAFLAPNLARVIRTLDAGRFVVYGVVTEVCVLYAARGLWKLGRPVTVVTDAIEALSEAAARQALDEMRASGATLATMGDVLAD
jgi:nicotinamidase/pyrazinamidase